MRKTLVFFIFSALMLGPAFSSALEPAQLAKINCGARTGAPSPQKKTVGFSTGADEIKSHLHQNVLCPNSCYDIYVLFDVGFASADITITGTNKCKQSNNKPQDEKRGCAKGEANPLVTVRITGSQNKTIGPKSRCDTEGLLDTADAMSKKDTDTAIARFEGLSVSVEPTPTVGSVNGSDSVAKAFLVGQGVSEERAQTIISENPDAAKTITECATTGCSAEKLKSATAGLGITLNSDTNDYISKMKAEWQETNGKTAETDNGSESDVTGFSGQKDASGLPTQCGISGIAGNIMLAESSCGRINHNPLSSVQGPYHFLCATWQQYVYATGVGNPDCQYRNDTQMSTQVMNAMMDQHWQKYGSTCSSLGVTQSSCLYSIHVWGEGGFNRIMQSMAANPDAPASSLCGSALSTSACRNNWSIISQSGTVAGMFQNFDSRLTGNRIIGSVSQAPLSPFSGFSGQTYYDRPYGSFGGSPFAQVNPVGYAMAPQMPAYTPPYTPPAQQPTQPQTPTGTGQPQIPTGTTTANIPAVATLIAQPSTVQKGKPISISWSSVGMSTQEPCRMHYNNIFFAQGNEGTRSFPTQSLLSGETIKFKLQCTPISGATIERETAVRVQ